MHVIGLTMTLTTSSATSASMSTPRRAPARGARRTARPRARAATPRAANVEDAGENARADVLSGERYDAIVTTTWEATAPFFYPRLALVGALGAGLFLSLPSSVGDVARGGDAGVLIENVVALAACGALATADVRRRNAAVKRLNRELALGKMVVIQRNKFREETMFDLGSLRDVARIAVVYGDASKVEKDLVAATPYRRRLEQSRILVVPVVERSTAVADAGAVADVGPGRWELLRDVVKAWPGAGAGRWLAWPTRNDDWSGFFRRLIGEDTAKQKGGYLTISTSGLVRGSGVGSPNWDVLLSTFPRNRPGNKQDEDAEKAWKKATLDSFEELTAREGSSSARGGGRSAVSQALPSDVPELSTIIAIHEAFYAALDAGDEKVMSQIWAKGRSKRDASSAVKPLVDRGARIDGWDTVLKPDRRPVGIKINDVDVTIEKGVATLTCLETVTNGATLLATQTFEREGDETSDWVLTGHTTIPYGADVVAKVVLRCDCEGCVAVPAKAVASGV